MDINLLKNYNMNLADIYKQLNHVEEYIPQYVPKQGMSGLKKFILTLVTALFCFSLIAILLIIVFNPFKKPVVITYPPPEAPPAVKPDIVPALPGYVQIQVIDFTLDPAGSGEATSAPSEIVVLPSISNPELNPDKAKDEPAQNNKTEAPAAKPDNQTGRPPARPTNELPLVAGPATPPSELPVMPMYAVLLAGATPGEYDILNSLAQSEGALAEITNTRTTTEIRWTVYTPQAGTGLMIADIEVTPLKRFTSRAEAVAYAQNYGADSIIKTEEAVHPVYELRVCCMELEAAKLFAQKTGIIDKVFQLRRE